MAQVSRILLYTWGGEEGLKINEGGELVLLKFDLLGYLLNVMLVTLGLTFGIYTTEVRGGFE